MVGITFTFIIAILTLILPFDMAKFGAVQWLVGVAMGGAGVYAGINLIQKQNIPTD